MNLKLSRYFQTLCATVTCVACSEVIEPAEQPDGAEYYPLQVGNEWVYQQIDIAFEISGFDTTEYLVREQVIAVDTLSATVQRFTIEKSLRPSIQEIWEVASRYTVKQSKEWIITQIGNKTETTLSFPIKDEKQWDYNSHSTLGTSMVKYQDKTSEIASESTYDDLMLDQERVFVIISDIQQNIVNQNEQYELYVKGVGLIEKKSLVLEFCTVNCDSAGQINTGYFSLKQLVDYDVD